MQLLNVYEYILNERLTIFVYILGMGSNQGSNQIEHRHPSLIENCTKGCNLSRT